MGFDPLKKLKELARAAEEAAKRAAAAAKQAAEEAARLAAAPVKVGVNIVRGESPKDAVKYIIDTVTDSASAAAEAANTPNFIVVRLAEVVGGGIGATIAQIAVAEKTAQLAVVDVLAAFVKNPTLKPEELLALPISTQLAAWLQQSAFLFDGEAIDVPFMVKQLLASHYPSGTIDRTRYVVGKIGVTLPEITNGVQSFMGNNGHAVTVPGIIVFSIEPDGSEQSLHWWAHELQHIVQYETLGVQGFATEYVRDYKAIEEAAETKAQSIVPL